MNILGQLFKSATGELQDPNLVRSGDIIDDGGILYLRIKDKLYALTEVGLTEKVAHCTTDTPTVAASTPVDVVGMTLSLVSGIWDITLHGTISVQSIGGSNIQASMYVTDSGNNNIGTLQAYLYHNALGAGNTTRETLNITERISVTTTTIYKARIMNRYIDTASKITAMATVVDPSNFVRPVSFLRAVKIK